MYEFWMRGKDTAVSRRKGTRYPRHKQAGIPPFKLQPSDAHLQRLSLIHI